MVPKRNRGASKELVARTLLGGCVFGDGLGALGDGMFGQFTREQEADSCLDLPGGDGGALVVVS